MWCKCNSLNKWREAYENASSLGEGLAVTEWHQYKGHSETLDLNAFLIPAVTVPYKGQQHSQLPADGGKADTGTHRSHKSEVLLLLIDLWNSWPWGPSFVGHNLCRKVLAPVRVVSHCHYLQLVLLHCHSVTHQFLYLRFFTWLRTAYFTGFLLAYYVDGVVLILFFDNIHRLPTIGPGF